jgi:hypothetical protein
MAMTKPFWQVCAHLLAWALLLSTGTAASAQNATPARAVLEAMGGLERLRGLDNVVLTGFGQRIYFQGGGNLTGDEHAPPKWQSVTDAQRTFDLHNQRALNQERRAYEFPFAGLFGLNFARNVEVQTGDLLRNLAPFRSNRGSSSSSSRSRVRAARRGSGLTPRPICQPFPAGLPAAITWAT